jgi:hypothetical protein
MILNKDVIDFEIQDDVLVIAQGNELIISETSQVLLNFENLINAGSLVIDKDKYFAGDIFGNYKQRCGSEIIDIEYLIKGVLDSNSFLVQLKSPKRMAKIDSKGSIHWEVEFKSFRYHLAGDEIVLLEDKREGQNQKLVGVNQITGQQLYELEFGTSLPKILGSTSEIVWIANNDHKFIKSFDPRTGQMLDKVSSGPIQELLQHQIDIEYFKFDAKSLKLIQPLGDFELASKSFVKRNYFESLEINGDLWVPSVFPFAFNDKNLTFGLQVDSSKTKETETRLIVMQRVDDCVIMDVSINIEKPDAGLKKITLTKDKLTYIDSFNNLHQLTLPLS